MSSRLELLPRELRLKIIEEAIEPQEVSFEALAENAAPLAPPLTLVSKTLRRDALEVFYKTSTFTIDVRVEQSLREASVQEALGRLGGTFLKYIRRIKFVKMASNTDSIEAFLTMPFNIFVLNDEVLVHQDGCGCGMVVYLDQKPKKKCWADVELMACCPIAERLMGRPRPATSNWPAPERQDFLKSLISKLVEARAAGTEQMDLLWFILTTPGMGDMPQIDTTDTDEFADEEEEEEGEEDVEMEDEEE